MRALAVLAILLTAVAADIASGTRYSLSTTWPLLAVDEGGRGRVVYVTIEVACPGSGLLTAEPPGAFDRSFMLSARYALLLASLFTGFNYSSCDFGLRLANGQGVTLSGGSAALALFMAFAGLERGSAEPVPATGVLGPGGLVGLVGGLSEKVSAAREASYELVVGPATNESWPGYRGVWHALQALALLAPSGTAPSITLAGGGNPSHMFAAAAERYRGLAKLYLDEAASLGAACEASRYVSAGDEALSRGMVYAATSTYFVAAFHALQCYLGALRSSNPGGFQDVVSAISSWASGNLSLVEGALGEAVHNVSAATPWDIDVAYNAYIRYLMAKGALVAFLTNPNRYDLVAIALLRALSALDWLSLAGRGNETSAVNVSGAEALVEGLGEVTYSYLASAGYAVAWRSVGSPLEGPVGGLLSAMASYYFMYLSLSSSGAWGEVFEPVLRSCNLSEGLEALLGAVPSAKATAGPKLYAEAVEFYVEEGLAGFAIQVAADLSVELALSSALEYGSAATRVPLVPSLASLPTEFLAVPAALVVLGGLLVAAELRRQRTRGTGAAAQAGGDSNVEGAAACQTHPMATATPRP
ncbi:MAG: hypothetical protein ABWK00_05600 [Desulfurococcaceae archaeon]